MEAIGDERAEEHPEIAEAVDKAVSERLERRAEEASQGEHGAEQQDQGAAEAKHRQRQLSSRELARVLGAHATPRGKMPRHRARPSKNCGDSAWQTFCKPRALDA